MHRTILPENKRERLSSRHRQMTGWMTSTATRITVGIHDRGDDEYDIDFNKAEDGWGKDCDDYSERQMAREAGFDPISAAHGAAPARRRPTTAPINETKLNSVSLEASAHQRATRAFPSSLQLDSFRSDWNGFGYTFPAGQTAATAAVAAAAAVCAHRLFESLWSLRLAFVRRSLSGPAGG